MRIEEVNDTHIPIIIDLAHRIWPSAYSHILTDVQLDNLLSNIYCQHNLCSEMARGHRFWIAYEADTPVGYMSGYREADIIWLKKLYVLPEHQGRGIGRALMNTLLATLSPARRINILVNANNISAQHMYTHMGFERTERMAVKMGDYFFTDFVFSKPLLAA